MAKTKSSTNKNLLEPMSDEELAFKKLYSLKELLLFKERNEDELRGTIAECTAIINTAEENLKKHPDYIRAHELLAPLEKDLRDTKKYQDIKRRLASHLLQSGKAKKVPIIRKAES